VQGACLCLSALSAALITQRLVSKTTNQTELWISQNTTTVVQKPLQHRLIRCDPISRCTASGCTWGQKATANMFPLAKYSPPPELGVTKHINNRNILSSDLPPLTAPNQP